ncbi:hypothetical protein [Sphingomonas sp. SRS2]|uniref:hypothetical protein n=1 Tax=Sphingomonas sp. SRS2 TaxID=133190 RepID=UPI000618497F|nr:hypothetical protein [Sphingomonas sp. SRS2]KKC24676.1 hypothetical protein WP12_17730 [Sphingomonas sp. SRS2]
MARGISHFPEWTHWVSEMKLVRDAKPDDFGVSVNCDICKQWRSVDLDAIIAMKGENFSLINKRFRCKLTPGCEGWNAFHYQSGVYRPLWTEAQADRWIYQDYERKRRVEAARAYIGALLTGNVVRDDPAPLGVDPNAWAIANDGERRRLIRQARG